MRTGAAAWSPRPWNRYSQDAIRPAAPRIADTWGNWLIGYRITTGMLSRIPDLFAEFCDVVSGFASTRRSGKIAVIIGPQPALVLCQKPCSTRWGSQVQVLYRPLGVK
jgi:hypothetical protein